MRLTVRVKIYRKDPLARRDTTVIRSLLLVYAGMADKESSYTFNVFLLANFNVS
jgi:hypothetical protein